MTDNISDDTTREEYRESLSAKPQPKVTAAATGAGVGAAVSTIGIWAVEFTTKIDIPQEVESAIVIVVSVGLSFLAGYFKKN